MNVRTIPGGEFQVFSTYQNTSEQKTPGFTSCVLSLALLVVKTLSEGVNQVSSISVKSQLVESPEYNVSQYVALVLYINN